MLGKRGVGRPRISWLRNLRTWFGTNTTDLFGAAVQKVKIAVSYTHLDVYKRQVCGQCKRRKKLRYDQETVCGKEEIHQPLG